MILVEIAVCFFFEGELEQFIPELWINVCNSYLLKDAYMTVYMSAAENSPRSRKMGLSRVKNAPF